MSPQKRAPEPYDKIPGLTAWILTMGFGLVLAVVVEATGLRWLRLPVIGLVCLFFAVVWRCVWAQRHPDKKMTFHDGPLAGILPYVATLTAVLLLKTVYPDCPPLLFPVVFFSTMFGTAWILWVLRENGAARDDTD